MLVTREKSAGTKEKSPLPLNTSTRAWRANNFLSVPVSSTVDLKEELPTTALQVEVEKLELQPILSETQDEDNARNKYVPSSSPIVNHIPNEIRT